MYKAVIGLETHCELNTLKKVFSSSSNIYSTEPNVNISCIDLGFPGILPIVNKESVVKALKAAIALNCDIAKELKFDRKNYFYPDLPKGYQITQSRRPIGINGYLMINNDDGDKKVLIHDIHLEEDSANLDHTNDSTLIDYNRAGVPLIEIVTEPCLNSADEAINYLESLRNLLLYCDLSDARADRGQIRCDVNVSLMKDDAKEFGTKVEIKNVNSFANVKDAINSEIKRQEELLNKGEKIVQETRRYDELTKETYHMREKVEAVDYKYFPESNIPTIKLDDSLITELKEILPILPYERKKKYLEYGLNPKDVKTLIKDKKLSDYYEELLKEKIEPMTAINWMTSVILPYLNKLYMGIDEIKLTPVMIKNIIDLVNDNKISNKQAKDILNKALEDEKDPMEIYKSSNVTQITDTTLIRNMLVKLLDSNPNLVKDYKNGKNVFNFFVGQVMKETKGQANPKITSEILLEEIKKR